MKKHCVEEELNPVGFMAVVVLERLVRIREEHR
jgi:hypothetical protein